MNAKMAWSCIATVLLLASAVANQPPDAEQPSGPGDVARRAVDWFLQDYRPGMDTASIKRLTSYVVQYCGWLALMRDFRIVKPFIKCLADTAALPDGARQDMLHTLGVLGDMAAAKVAMKYAVDTTMAPLVRYEAAVAICFLGNADAGTQVLKDLVLANALPPGYTFTPRQFLDLDHKPKKLKSAADEKALAVYIRWLAERTTNADVIDYSVCYLLQKDEDSRNFALRVAERALQSPDVYLSGRNDKRSLLSTLAGFGGERGKALAARFEK
jgi:hypothetical protein